MFSAFINSFKIPELRQRIIFTLALLVIVRLGAAIPCPGINAAVLQEYFRVTIEQSNQGNILGLFNLFSGGALQNCAVFSLTIMPYISASIIMQLATGAIPSLSKLSREEGGRQKINQYTRIGTLGLCLFQGYLLAVNFENPENWNVFPNIGQVTDVMGPLVPDPGLLFRITTVVTLTAGTMMLMWLGEQITDKGIGNGISLIITVGIVAQLPTGITAGWKVFSAPDATAPEIKVVLLLLFLFIVVASTVAITQALRKIPVQYARQVRGNKVYGGQTSYLPLKVNYAGVMPIIFANAVLLFPGTIIQLLFPDSDTASRIVSYLNPGGALYYSVTGLTIFFFSYFWVAMMFNPTQISDDMKRNGGFIPGVRPGDPTAKFLDFTMTRLTFFGAVFLAGLAILPMFVSERLGIPYLTAQFFGGTSLLIIVGVILDTMRQTETYLLQRHYDGFLKKGRIRGRSGAGAGASAGASVPETRIIWLIVAVAVLALGGIIASAIRA
ncbi:MAG: preprotein translocase subunit SecY [Verrucomicrobiota bacterium]